MKRGRKEPLRAVKPDVADRDSYGFEHVYPGSTITDDVQEFVMAMDRYKREHHRPFPTWSEVLEVARSLGYRKVT